ncbi:hypothetical protein AB4Y45_33560 [Paraburkholderia sp. EG287A]|uniref:hypothetical protein n=1 Tax=Paraburkholderia sp. EG287A TaxID=3237012 RepID=UPI0034D178C5
MHTPQNAEQFVTGAAARLSAGMAAYREQQRAGRLAFTKSDTFRRMLAVMTVREPRLVDSVASEIFPEDILTKPEWKGFTVSDLRQFLDVFEDTQLEGVDASSIQRESHGDVSYVNYRSYGLFVTVVLGGRGCNATYVRNIVSADDPARMPEKLY